MDDESSEPSRAEIPPLNLEETVLRQDLYERLAAAMHNMRISQLPERGSEEMEAVKITANADTTELRLPKPPPSERKVIDAIRRLGGRF